LTPEILVEYPEMKQKLSKNTLIYFLLIALLIVFSACSSTRKPLRPAVKHKKRNCDCSRWGYIHPTEKTSFVWYARGN
jgi:hypothetical protein